MTSTIFSSKTFPKLYKWAFKRNKAIIIIFTVMMSLGILLDLFAMSELSRTNSSSQIADFGNVGTVSIIIAQGGALVFTFISALLTFSFLHNKRSIDMFGSLPTTRGTLYISHLLGGLTAVAAPFVVGSLIVTGLTCRTFQYLMWDLLLILCGLLGMLAAYVFTTLIAYCCGTIMDTAIITLAINAIYIGTVAIFWGMASEMIEGIEFESIIYNPVFLLLAPYTFCFFEDAYLMIEENSALMTLLFWNLVFVAGTVALRLYTARKRKAEIAQSDFDAKWLPIVVKAGGSVVCGGLVGFIAASESSSGYGNMFVFALWYLIISFAAFFILHVIFARGLKGKFKQSLIAYIATTVAALAIVFGLTTGLGIDVYVPNPANVRSVEFYGYTFKDPENVKTVTEIHKIITQGVRTEGNYPYYLGSASYQYEDDVAETPDTVDYDYDYYNSQSSYDRVRSTYPLLWRSYFEITYKKKVGFATKRCYSLYVDDESQYDYAAIEKLLEKLYSSEEYKRQNNELLWNEKKRAEVKQVDATLSSFVRMPGMSYYSSSRKFESTDTITLRTDMEFLNGLYDAIAEDILNDSEYYQTVDPDRILNDWYFTINISYKDKPVYEYDIYGYSYYGGFNRMDIIVKSSYTKTLEYLKANHYPANPYEEYDDGLIFDPVLTAINSGDGGYSSYEVFGNSGDYYAFYEVITQITPVIEYNSLVATGYTGDIDKWSAENSEEFASRLRAKAEMLYEKYKDDPDYIVYGYTNPNVVGKNFEDGSYFYLLDRIIQEVSDSGVGIVNEINGTTPKPAEKDKADSSAKAESKPESEAIAA